jgi:hypothetical protein
MGEILFSMIERRDLPEYISGHHHSGREQALSLTVSQRQQQETQR